MLIKDKLIKVARISKVIFKFIYIYKIYMYVFIIYVIFIPLNVYMIA